MAATDAMASDKVRVAILGTTLLGRADLRRGLEQGGLQVAVEETLTSFLSDIDRQGQVDVILVDLEQADDDDLDILDALVAYSPVPMVFHDVSGRAENAAWLKRLAEKLIQAAREAQQPKEKPKPQPAPAAKAAPAPAPAPAPAKPPQKSTIRGLRCWVLGASFGGPEALKRFLTAMPEVPANTAFVIGQHIGDGFVEVLASQLNRATEFKVAPAVEGAQLEAGRIYVAPVRERLRIDPMGVIHLQPETQPRTYMPSIDAIMEEVAERFGPDCGAIIFSGMGDDGAKGCIAVARAGGIIWAQDRATCAIDSMPTCARNTGLVRHGGSPEQMAVDLVALLKSQAAKAAG